MSKNSKNATRLIQARKRSAERKNGNKGPASTTAKHNKKRAWWQLGSYADWVKGPKKVKRGPATEDGPV